MATNKSLKKSSFFKEEIDFELWKSLDHVHSAISRSRGLELTQYGVTQEQAAVLSTLLEKGGSTTNAEIANIMIRQYNSITTMVNRMEKSGLVKKEKSAGDKRFVVSITSKGRSISERITRNSIHIALSGLSIEEKQKLASYLKNIVEKSRSMLGMDQLLPFMS